MNEPLNNEGDIIIYQTEDGLTKIDVKMGDETVWLTQAQMAELFQKDRTVIGRPYAMSIKKVNLKRKSHVQNLHIWVMMANSFHLNTFQ